MRSGSKSLPMMPLYHIISTLAVLLAAPFSFIHALTTGKKRRGLWHRLGFVPPLPEADLPDTPTLWLHALSLGEVTAARPVLHALKQKAPGIRIAVSVTTDTGYDGAQQHLDFADRIFFHPHDAWPCNKAAVERIRPDLFVLMDTGFWPGFLHHLDRKKIPALLFNGRISKRSLRRYQVLRSFFRTVFNRFDLLGMNNAGGAEAMRVLGVDRARVQVTGDPKFDGLQIIPPQERTAIRNELRIPDSGRVWVAGSTHAGEEEIVLSVHQKLKSRFPDLLLILAPRRLERIGDLTALLTRRKIPFARRSRIDPAHAEVRDVLLLDTMGELASAYAIAQIAFVGRSLLPPGGGHSLMEPAACGIPVLHGPHIENFRPLATEFQEQGCAFEVRNEQEMTETLTRLLDDEAARSRIAAGAPALIENHRGASARMAGIILETLNVG